MSILFLLIPLSLILLGVAIWAFFWAVDSNQFDDLSGPAYSILYDDDVKKMPRSDSETVAPANTEADTDAADEKNAGKGSENR